MNPPNLSPLFKFWNSLAWPQRKHLLSQIKKIDFSLLNQQKQLLLKSPPFSSVEQTFEPFLDFAYAGNQQDQQEGKKRIREGQMGCLVLAGGQGSRLYFEDPKGMFPVSLIKHKSLFQLCAEKVLAAGKQVDRLLPIAIMTSPQNDSKIRHFFNQHAFFGLDSCQISFFTQGTLPLLDSQGCLFLETPSQIASGPNGNGYCFKDFIDSGIASNWIKQGVQYINMILIDNPLANPFDAELLGFHCRQNVDVTLKCTEKQSAAERVGVLVRQNRHCRVIEYSEISEKEQTALASDGRLKHRCANLSLFCFSMNFIQQLNSQQHSLPLHAVWKAAKYVDEQGISHLPDKPNAWKFETFIFDLLAYTNRIAALLYPREECFAPLKNFKGSDSLETVQAALQRRDRQIIHKITNLPPPMEPFELAADFYYPTPALISKWKNCPISTGYIEP